MKFDFGTRKGFTQVWFQLWTDWNIAGCIPREFKVKFNNSTYKVDFTFGVTLQSFEKDKPVHFNSSYNISYEYIDGFVQERGIITYSEAAKSLWPLIITRLHENVDCYIKGDYRDMPENSIIRKRGCFIPLNSEEKKEIYAVIDKEKK